MEFNNDENLKCVTNIYTLIKIYLVVDMLQLVTLERIFLEIMIYL